MRQLNIPIENIINVYEAGKPVSVSRYEIRTNHKDSSFHLSNVKIISENMKDIQ